MKFFTDSYISLSKLLNVRLQVYIIRDYIGIVTYPVLQFVGDTRGAVENLIFVHRADSEANLQEDKQKTLI